MYLDVNQINRRSYCPILVIWIILKETPIKVEILNLFVQNLMLYELFFYARDSILEDSFVFDSQVIVHWKVLVL